MLARDPSRPHHSASEAALVDRLLGSMPTVQAALGHGDNALVVMREFQVGIVVPDIVLVRLPTSGPLLQLRRPLSHFHCCVWSALLRRTPLRAETLARRLFTGVDRIHLALRDLRRADIVAGSEDENASSLDRLLPNEAEVVALEAKLARWRLALRQAQGYLAFSNRVAVALPRNRFDGKKEVLAACRKQGVGLFLEGESTTALLHVPGRRRIMTPEWLWVLSKAAVLVRRGEATLLPPGTFQKLSSKRPGGLTPFED